MQSGVDFGKLLKANFDKLKFKFDSETKEISYSSLILDTTSFVLFP